MTYADGRYGALDIGTVTCRLLVADVEDGRIIDVDKEYAITDLGVGVDATGRLSEAAIERVLACVDRYLEVLARYDTPEHPVRRLIAMATSASRDAANGPEFAARLAERGVTLAVIPGSREAQLTFLGASSDFPGENLLVVDIGGGTTDIAVLSLNGIATSSSIKVAGDTFDEAVAAYMRKHYGMLIGLNTAEEVKITIGCVYPRPQELSMLVKGRDAKTGLPNEVTISSTEMLDAFKRPARQIVDEVLAVLEHSSPELVADIAQTGIVLTGGGSLLYGFDKLISERTEIACSIADDADSCVANGCGRSLQWISSMQEGTINLARRKLMKEQ